MTDKKPARQLSLSFHTDFDASSPARTDVRAPVNRPAAREVGRPGRVSERLPPGPPERVEALSRALRLLLDEAVTLQVHDNRSTMISFRRSRDVLVLRVHHMFLDGGPEVVRALAEYARTRSARSGRVLDRFVREHRETIRPVEAQGRPLRTRGEVHDLGSIFRRLNALYFADTIEAEIGWGRGARQQGRRRSIRMGAYFEDTRTLLIHPALDRPEVPGYFVELVVYHEMLHQAVPASRDASGRRTVHPPEFRRRERLFPEWERARSWEKQHLNMLLHPPKN